MLNEAEIRGLGEEQDENIILTRNRKRGVEFGGVGECFCVLSGGVFLTSYSHAAISPALNSAAMRPKKRGLD